MPTLEELVARKTRTVGTKPGTMTLDDLAARKKNLGGADKKPDPAPQEQMQAQKATTPTPSLAKIASDWLAPDPTWSGALGTPSPAAPGPADGPAREPAPTIAPFGGAYAVPGGAAFVEANRRPWRPKPNPVGFVERIISKPLAPVPGLGVGLEIAQAQEYHEAARRLEQYRNGYPEVYQAPRRISHFAGTTPVFVTPPAVPGRQQQEADQRIVKAYEDKKQEAKERGMSSGGHIAAILQEMPAFMADIMVTGGLGGAVKAGTEKALSRGLIKKGLKTVAGKAAGKVARATGSLAGGAAQGTVMGHRIAENYLQRRMPQNVEFDEEGNPTFTWPTEKPFTSLMKAWGDTAIEAASEMSGPGLKIGARGVGKFVGKTQIGGKILPKIYAKYRVLHPDTSWRKFLDLASNKVSFDGILEEVGEEYLGDQMRAVTNVDDFGADEAVRKRTGDPNAKAGILDRMGHAFYQDLVNTPEMIAAFAVPGGAQIGAEQIGEAIDARRPAEIDPQALDALVGKSIRQQAQDRYQQQEEAEQRRRQGRQPQTPNEEPTGPEPVADQGPVDPTTGLPIPEPSGKARPLLKDKQMRRQLAPKEPQTQSLDQMADAAAQKIQDKKYAGKSRTDLVNEHIALYQRYETMEPGPEQNALQRQIYNLARRIDPSRPFVPPEMAGYRQEQIKREAAEQQRQKGWAQGLRQARAERGRAPEATHEEAEAPSVPVAAPEGTAPAPVAARPQAVQEPGPATGKEVEPQGNWREAVEKENNLSRKADILRAIADVSQSDDELADVLRHVAKGSLPDQGNILAAVEHNPHASEATQQRAREAYDQVFALKEPADETRTPGTAKAETPAPEPVSETENVSPGGAVPAPGGETVKSPATGTVNVGPVKTESGEGAAPGTAPALPETPKGAQKGATRLKGDYGVDYIDGYNAPDERGAGPEKEAFLADAQSYLRRVSKNLGWQPQPDRSGKVKNKSGVSVNRGGIAVSGEAYLHLRVPGRDMALTVEISGSGPIPGVKASRSHVTIRWATDEKGGPNTPNHWEDWDITAEELAEKIRQQHGQTAPTTVPATAPAKPAAPVVAKTPEEPKPAAPSPTPQQPPADTEGWTVGTDERPLPEIGENVEVVGRNGRSGTGRVIVKLKNAVRLQTADGTVTLLTPLRWRTVNETAPATGPEAPASPSMKSWREFKAKNPGIVALMKVGDDYETYGNDAGLVSKVTGLPLERTPNIEANTDVTVRIPADQVRTVMRKVLKTGHNVAMFEPEEQKAAPTKTDTVSDLPAPATTPKPAYGSQNTLVSQDEYERMKALLKKSGKLPGGRQSGGTIFFSPEEWEAVVKIGLYHFEAGARQFAAWAKKVVEDLGEGIRPYLDMAWDEIQERTQGLALPPGPAVESGQQETTDEAGPRTTESDAGEGDRPQDVGVSPGPGAQGGTAVRPGQTGQPPVAGTPGSFEPDVHGPEQGPGSGVRGPGVPGPSVGVGGQPPTGGSGGNTSATGGNAVVPAASNDDVDAPGQRTSLDENYDLRSSPPIELTKSQRRQINEQVKAILAKKEITEDDRDILRQYTGEGGLSSGADYKHESLNQHYTDYATIKAIWRAIHRSGFRAEKVLEPAVGSGNFVGMQPQLDWTTVDIDKTNNEVVKRLYPKGRHYNVSFGDFLGTGFDLVISNVPFSEERGKDRNANRRDIKALHDFYFVHALTTVRDNGVIAFITSTGTMDKLDSSIRKEIVSQADVLGAFRLPQGHFARNAHTQVMTDVIFLQKRPAGAVPNQEQAAINDAFAVSSRTGDDIPLSNYYQRFPDHVLGDVAIGKDRLHGGRKTYVVSGDANLDEIAFQYRAYPSGGIGIDQTLSDVPQTSQEFYQWAEDHGVPFRDQDHPRYGENLIVEHLHAGDEVFVATGEILFTDIRRKVKVFSRGTGEAIDKLSMLDTIRQKAEAFQAGDKEAGPLGVELIGDYKQRFGKHPKNDRALKKFFADHEELSYFNQLASLFDLKWNPADVFLTRTRYTGSGKATPAGTLTERAFANEDNRGVIRIADAQGLTEGDVLDLLGQGYALVSRTDEGSILQNEILYYSGNIYEKIDGAKAITAPAEYQPFIRTQIERLEAIKPEPKPFDEIRFKGSEEWVYPFINRTTSWQRRIDPRTGMRYWDTGDQLLDRYLDNHKLLERRKDDHGNFVQTLDEYMEDVRLAEEHVAQMLDDVRQVIHRTPSLLKAAEEAYNRRFRNYVRPDYEKAQYLVREVLEEIEQHSSIRLRKNQLEWLVQAVYEGKGINAHDVGGGKTFAAIALARALKNRGVAKKPLFVVPAKTIKKWHRDILKLFPNAKVVDLGNLAADKRNQALHALANSNADYVLVSQEGFEKIKLPAAIEEQYLDAVMAEHVDDPSVHGRNRATLEDRIDRLKDAIHKENRDVRLTFDKLGIDMIVADEAHAYKNIGIRNNLVNFGLGKGFSAKSRMADTGRKDADGKPVLEERVSISSARAYDFRFKSNYVLEHNNGKNIFLLTATPTPNKPMEIYTMIRHLSLDIFHEYGIHSDQDFADTFFKLGTVKSEAKGKEIQILRAIVNAQELRGILNRFVDRIPMEQMPWITVPQENPVRHILDRPDAYLAIAEDLKNRQQNRPRPARQGDDTLAGIYQAARGASVDVRLYGDPHSAPEARTDVRSYDATDDKIQWTIDAVQKVHQDNPNAGQLIFLEAAGWEQVERGQLPEDLHAEIKDQLVKAGFKPTEVAIINGKFVTNVKTGRETASGDKDEKKQEIADAYNEGKIKVVIGTTSSMGEGMDLQVKTTDIYHVDIPYKPGEFRQRNGRGIRYGNENAVVNTHYLMMRGTFDSLSMGIVANKRGWNEAIWDKEVADEISTEEEMGEGGMPPQQLIEIELEPDPRRKQYLVLSFQYQRMNEERSGIFQRRRTIRERLDRVRNALRERQEVLKGQRQRLADLKPKDTIKDEAERQAHFEKSKKVLENSIEISLDKEKEIQGRIAELEQRQRDLEQQEQKADQDLAEFRRKYMNDRGEIEVPEGATIEVPGILMEKSQPDTASVDRALRVWAEANKDRFTHVPAGVMRHLLERMKQRFETHPELAEQALTSEGRLTTEEGYEITAADVMDYILSTTGGGFSREDTLIGGAETLIVEAGHNAGMYDYDSRIRFTPEGGKERIMTLGHDAVESAKDDDVAAVALYDQIRAFLEDQNDDEGGQGAKQKPAPTSPLPPDVDNILKGLGIDTSTIRPVTQEDIDRVKRELEESGDIEQWTPEEDGDESGIEMDELQIGGEIRAISKTDPALIATLARNLYPGQMDRIIVKEMLQNAHDAVMSAPDPSTRKVTVDINTPSRTIAVEDNGIGMTREVATTALVNQGGSFKVGESSGGFGLAKYALFGNSKNILVETTVYTNGHYVTTMLEGSGQDWADTDKGLRVSTLTDQRDTTGTRIVLTLNKAEENGIEEFSSWTIQSFLSEFQSLSDLPYQMDFSVNGDRVEQKAGLTTRDLKKLPTIAKEDGFRIQFYTGSALSDAAGRYKKVVVLNRGIYQFSTSVYVGAEVRLPEVIVANVTATVKPTENHYPFTANREGMKQEVTDAIERYVRDNIAKEVIAQSKAKYRRIWEEAPLIAGTKAHLVDGTGQIPDVLLQEWAKNPIYTKLAKQVKMAYSLIWKKIQSAFDETSSWPDKGALNLNLHWHGLAISREWKGVHVPGSFVGSKDNQIFTNVAGMWEQYVPGPRYYANIMGGQIAANLLHEIVHQKLGRHDADYAGWFTTFDGMTIMEQARAARAIARVFEEFTYEELDDFFGTQYAEAIGADLFGKISSRERLPTAPGSDAGDAGERQEAGSGRGQAPQNPQGTPGQPAPGKKSRLTRDEIKRLRKEKRAEGKLREGQQEGEKVGYHPGYATARREAIVKAKETLHKLRLERYFRAQQREEAVQLIQTYVPKDKQGRYLKWAVRATTPQRVDRLLKAIQHFLAKADHRAALSEMRAFIKKTKRQYAGGKMPLGQLEERARDAILRFLDTYDLSKLSRKTGTKLANRREYVQWTSAQLAALWEDLDADEGEYEHANNYLRMGAARIAELKRLSKIPLKKLGADEIRGILDGFKELLRVAELKGDIKYRTRIEKLRDGIRDATKHVAVKTPEVGNVTDRFGTLKWLTVRGQSRIDTLVGLAMDKDDSAARKILFEDLEDASDKTMAKAFEQFDHARKAMKRIGFGQKEWDGLDETVKVTLGGKTFEMPIRNLAILYAHTQNADNLEQLLKTEGLIVNLYEKDPKTKIFTNRRTIRTGQLKPSEIVDAIGKLPQIYVQFVHDVLFDTNEKVGAPAMNETSRRLENYDVARIKNYVHLPREVDRIIEGGRLDTSTAPNKAGRVQFRTGGTNRIFLDTIDNELIEQIQFASEYYGMTEALQAGRTLLADHQFRDRMKETGNAPLLTQIETLFRRMQGVFMDQSQIEKSLGKVLSKYGRSILSLRVSGGLVQLTSPAATWGLVEPQYFLGLGVPTKKDLQSLKERFPRLRYRWEMGGFHFVLADLSARHTFESVLLGHNPVSEKLLHHYTLGDEIALWRVWRATQRKVEAEQGLKPNTPEGDAAAWEIYRKALNGQGQFDMLHRSDLTGNPNPLLKGSTMFTATTNAFYNTLVQAVDGYLKGRLTKRQAGKMIGGLVMSVTMATAVRRAFRLGVKAGLIMLLLGFRDDPDKEKLAGEILTEQAKKELTGLPSRWLAEASGLLVFGGVIDAAAQAISNGLHHRPVLDLREAQTGSIYTDIGLDMEAALEHLSGAVGDFVSGDRYESGPRKGQLKWKTSSLKATDALVKIATAFTGLPYSGVKGDVVYPYQAASRAIRDTKTDADLLQDIAARTYREPGRGTDGRYHRRGQAYQGQEQKVDELMAAYERRTGRKLSPGLIRREQLRLARAERIRRRRQRIYGRLTE